MEPAQLKIEYDTVNKGDIKHFLCHQNNREHSNYSIISSLAVKENSPKNSSINIGTNIGITY